MRTTQSNIPDISTKKTTKKQASRQTHSQKRPQVQQPPHIQKKKKHKRRRRRLVLITRALSVSNLFAFQHSLSLFLATWIFPMIASSSSCGLFPERESARERISYLHGGSSREKERTHEKCRRLSFFFYKRETERKKKKEFLPLILTFLTGAPVTYTQTHRMKMDIKEGIEQWDFCQQINQRERERERNVN